MKSKIISSTLLVLGFVLGATALSSIAAWSAPSVLDNTTNPPETGECTPPKCNTKAPIHVGSAQTKSGVLTLLADGTAAYGLEVANGIKLVDGNVSQAGYVLTNKTGTGVGTWEPVIGGTGGVSHVIECTASVPTSGATGNFSYTHIFTSAQCGNSLPTNEYYGALKGFSGSGGYVGPNYTDIKINNTPNGGPGFRLNYNKSSTNSSNPLIIDVVFIKPGSGGSSGISPTWTNVSLTNSDSFDTECTYRMRTTAPNQVFNVSIINVDRLHFVIGAGNMITVQKTNKGVGTNGSTNETITKIEKLCQ